MMVINQIVMMIKGDVSMANPQAFFLVGVSPTCFFSVSID